MQTIDLTETGGIAYDLNAEGDIVGIEILGIQRPEQIEIARAFADSRGLAFTRDLAGTLVAA